MYYAGAEGIRSALDLQTPIGLDLFASSSAGLPLVTLLHSINIFEALWLSYLYIALRRMWGCSKLSALLIAGIYGVVTVGLAVAFAVLSLDAKPLGA
jgi:hypothetical protein